MARAKAKKDEVNTSKTQYNKAQLEYLKERIETAATDALERWEKEHPEPPELSDKEKYRQIMEGEAKLKAYKDLDSYAPMRTDVEDAFDFNDAGERAQWREERKKIEKKISLLSRKATELIYLGDQAQLLSFLEHFEDIQFV